MQWNKRGRGCPARRTKGIGSSDMAAGCQVRGRHPMRSTPPSSASPPSGPPSFPHRRGGHHTYSVPIQCTPTHTPTYLARTLFFLFVRSVYEWYRSPRDEVHCEVRIQCCGCRPNAPKGWLTSSCASREKLPSRWNGCGPAGCKLLLQHHQLSQRSVHRGSRTEMAWPLVGRGVPAPQARGSRADHRPWPPPVGLWSRSAGPRQPFFLSPRPR